MKPLQEELAVKELAVKEPALIRFSTRMVYRAALRVLSVYNNKIRSFQSFCIEYL